MDAFDHDPDSPHDKPYADDLGELPPPMAECDRREYRPRTAARVPALLSNALWMAYGVAFAVLALGSPGCVGMGGPAMSAKADVSVKEAMLVAHGGPAGGGAGGSAGQGGRGEVVASVSFSMNWPGGGKAK